MQEKKLKQVINDYHFLTPGTTKWIKSKDPDEVPELNEVSTELDDQSNKFEIGFPVYKAFDNIKHKRKLLCMILSIICMKSNTMIEIKKNYITMKFLHIVIE